MTPEMWLDLSPSHTVLAHFVADRQTSSEVQRGVALQSSGLASFVCHPPSVVLLVPRLGGLGHKIFFKPSAWRAVWGSGLPGPDETDPTQCRNG